jgi:hypothetical protein
MTNKRRNKEKFEESPPPPLTHSEEQVILKEKAAESYEKQLEKYEKEKEDKEEDLVEFLRVSVNDAYDGNEDDGYYIPLHERQYEGFTDKYSTYFGAYSKLLFKYGLMVIFMSFNFIALSLSLNCNADKEFFTRLMSAIFAFLFGIVYIIINYYTYRVLHQGKICKINKEKLFPFKS